jgi:uncharacterized protein
MIFDPLYLVIIGVGLVLSLWAQARVKGAFNRYSRKATASRMTGADVARRILADNGIHDVRVETVSGRLSDHYDPRNKTLRLSEPVFGSNSMAAFGVAAHEVGHAIQHAQGYAPLKFRSAWVPVANFGSGLSIVVIILAALMGGAGTVVGHSLALLGVAMFGATTLLTLVTLPVEFDASQRAVLALERGGYVSTEELAGAKKVLNAAALTYVAAFVTSVLTLLYWAYRLGLFGGRN